MKTVKEEIANNLLYYRKKSKLTQKWLADQLGVKNNTISQWENATNSIDAEVLFRICEILHISVNDIYGIYANVQPENILPSENELLHSFRCLNQEGQEKILEYMDDLVQSGKYKKPDEFCLGYEEINKEA